MERTFRQSWAFVFRGFHLTRRYISWVIVFNFYALTTSATVALIGVAAGDYKLTLKLVVGALLWNFLSILYSEIAMSIAYERWEGTLEYTFMAPVSRLVHLAGVSSYALAQSVVNTSVVLVGLLLFTDLQLTGANLLGCVVVLLVSTLAFVGLGLMAAVLPVLSPERGAEATHIFQGTLLLVSGIYYPIEVLQDGFNLSRISRQRPTRSRRVANWSGWITQHPRRAIWSVRLSRRSGRNF